MTADAGMLTLNGFRVHLRPEEFAAYTVPLPDNSDLDQLQSQAGNGWSLWWNRGIVYGLPHGTATQLPGSVQETLAVSEHLGFVAYVINTALPRAVPCYKAFRNRPFTFLGNKGEFISEIQRKLANTPAVLSGFTIRPRYALEAKVVDLGGAPFIGLFATLSTRYEIGAELRDLAAAGVPLAGLDVVRRKPAADQRRLTGRIERLDGDEVILGESFDSLPRVAAHDVALEGSKEAFATCLKAILGGRYGAFENQRQRLEGELLGGPGVDAMLSEMGNFLSSVSPFRLGDDLECAIGERLSVANTGHQRSVHRAAPVSYCFDPARTKRNPLPWQGLARYGPFSRDTFATRSPRILVITPDTVQGTAETFIRAFRDGLAGGSAYPAGFAATFRLANPHYILQRVDSTAGRRPHEAYRAAIEEALSFEQRPDVALVVLLDEHGDLPDPVNPYLHAKALLLMAGIPSQEIRRSTMCQTGNSLAYTLQNASIAVYAKLHGVPWTVDQHLPIADEIVVGLGVAELSASRYGDRKRFMGVTTVFRGDGNYLLGSLSRECSFEEYPQALQESVLTVLAEIKERNGWRPGDTVRVVCHTSEPMRDRELGRLMAASAATVGGEQNVEFAFLTIGDRQPFSMLDPCQEGKKVLGQLRGVYAPERGTSVQISANQRLLAITGPGLIMRPGAPLPRQLHLRLHPTSTFRDLEYLTEQVLKFTSLSWRSTKPARRPVTIYYSELMADLLARLRAVPDWSPALLNTRLKYSRWFL